MNQSSPGTRTETQSVVVERDMPHPPAKVWHVLTQSYLIEEWLMKNDFKAVVGHRFNLDFEWGSVDCEVLAIEPQRTLSYTWHSGELESIVTWTLTPTDTGTRLRMEQTGFRPDDPGQARFIHGARGGWPRFFDAIADVLNRTE